MKWHFVHIPKTGGQSIEKALGIPNCHESAKYTPRPRFTFVRHPLDRLVSAWHYAWRKNNLVKGPMTVEALRALFATEHLLIMPQTHWLDDEMDFVGRFERITEDFKRISDVPLPHVNATEHKHWREYYADPAVYDLAVRQYRGDFDRLGYSPEVDP